MNVMHLSPTWFGDQSVVGGGERYAWELARACAAETPTTFVSFAESAGSRQEGPLRVRLLPNRANRPSPLEGNPFHPGLYAEIARADVIHCHQADTYPTNAAIVAGRMLARKVFVSDLGGGHMRAPSLRLPILPRATGMLLLSEYSKARWQKEPASRRPRRAEVVYGGVDARFAPSGERDPHHVLFVGRIVRHKGIEHAIAAIEPPFTMTVAGRNYDRPYAAMLRETAALRPVRFREDVADAALPALYSSALATVMPSTYDAWGGVHTDVPELLGLAALESMACGTPAIVSRVGSLPELVEDGVTGFIVPPNDPAAIRDALRTLAASPARRDEMGRAARAAVLARFTWQRTARRCLEAYRQ
jgi:glycosyltransferase involved in cell wall biosynthesis